jgi:hypothetical protein
VIDLNPCPTLGCSSYVDHGGPCAACRAALAGCPASAERSAPVDPALGPVESRDDVEAKR